MPRPPARQPRLVALFLFGVLLFNYPLLALFSRADEVLGVPLLYVYIFGAWALFVILLARAIERGR